MRVNPDIISDGIQTINCSYPYYACAWINGTTSLVSISGENPIFPPNRPMSPLYLDRTNNTLQLMGFAWSLENAYDLINGEWIINSQEILDQEKQNFLTEIVNEGINI